MKKSILCVALALLFTGCHLFDPPPPATPAPPPHYYTFAEVSKPYLDQYGAAEDVNEYTSASYHSIDWWWWTKGFEVSFLDTTYDDVNGWTVESTYSFTPI